MSPKLPVIADAAEYESRFNDEAWRQAAAIIRDRHGLGRESPRRSPEGEHIIFFVGGRFVIKIFSPFRQGGARERAALEFASGKLPIDTPALLHAGEIEGWAYLVMTRLGGSPAKEVWPEVERRDRVEIVTRVGAALRGLHGLPAPLADPALNRDWHGFVERQARTCVERQLPWDPNPEWVESLPGYVAARIGLLPAGFGPVMLHGDVHLGNLLLARRGGRWRVSGLFDFGDSMCGFHEYEFVAPCVLMLQGSRGLQRELLLAYGYGEAELDLTLRARLMLLTVLYECSNLRKYATRLRPEAVNFTLDELEAAIWRFAGE